MNSSVFHVVSFINIGGGGGRAPTSEILGGLQPFQLPPSYATELCLVQVELQYEVLEPLAYETPLNTESARNTIVEYEDTLPPPRTKSCDKEGVASGKGEWFMGGACRRACVALVVLVLCVMLVAALAAGVLALTIIFTGFIDICKCDTTNGEGDL